MPLRVLYLTDSLSDLDGVGRYTLSLLRALEADAPGFEPRILLARKHRPTSAALPAHWPVSVALPPDYFFYMSRGRFWPSLALASLRVARAARGCDLVHAIKDYPHNLVGVVGAKLAGKPCVATAHGTYSVQPLLDPRHASLARWTYKRVAAFVSVSAYTRRRMLAVAPPDVLPPENVHVIPNAVDAELYAHAPELGARPWHGKRYTLTIGELKERKGHHVALAAFVQVAARFPALEHFVVGHSARDAYFVELEQLVARAGLTSRVHFLGNVTEAEKIDLLQRAAVFLHTPVHARDGGFEGFGIVYLEAAACGVAAIGTRESGAEDAITHEVTGLLADADSVSVATALERLLADDVLRARLGAAARERARRATWRENARALQGLYGSVLQRSANVNR